MLVARRVLQHAFHYWLSWSRYVSQAYVSRIPLFSISKGTDRSTKRCERSTAGGHREYLLPKRSLTKPVPNLGKPQKRRKTARVEVWCPSTLIHEQGKEHSIWIRSRQQFRLKSDKSARNVHSNGAERSAAEQRVPYREYRIGKHEMPTFLI